MGSLSLYYVMPVLTPDVNVSPRFRVLRDWMTSAQGLASIYFHSLAPQIYFRTLAPQVLSRSICVHIGITVAQP